MNFYEKDPAWKFLRLPLEQLLKVTFHKFSNNLNFQEQSRPYDIKKNVWIPDGDDGYVAAEIISTKGDNVVIKIKDEEVSYSFCFLIFF